MLNIPGVFEREFTLFDFFNMEFKCFPKMGYKPEFLARLYFMYLSFLVFKIVKYDGK
jgi:hypothetical protein